MSDCEIPTRQKIRVFFTPSTISYGEHGNYHKQLISYYIIDEVQNSFNVYDGGLPISCCFIDIVTNNPE